MSDTIRLEVAASPDALPVVRMILGGVAARVELSLDEIQDLYLAVEQLFGVAGGSGEGPRLALEIGVSDDAITVTTGPFYSEALRARLDEPARVGELGLRGVLDKVVQSVEVCTAGEGCFAVAFTKQRRTD